MPEDECDADVEGHQDLEHAGGGDCVEPWHKDKDLTGDGDVGDQQDHSRDDVPAPCEEHDSAQRGREEAGGKERKGEGSNERKKERASKE